MRAFVAVELSEEVRGKLAELQRELPEGVKQVRPENMHLTLAFLGEVDGEKADEVKAALESVSAEQFEVRCKGAGVFPSENFVRVVWVGAESEELEALYKQVRDALRPLGFRIDQFSPHITIGRPKTRIEISEFLRKNEQKEFGAFKVERIVLKKSTLRPDGPVYEDVFEKRLG